MNFSLGNLFQSKFIDAEGKETKVDFFKANFSASHNFTAESFKWSDLRSNFSTTILGKSITVTTTHSLYKIKNNGDKIDRLFYQEGKLPQLKNLNTSFNYTINSQTFSSKEEGKKKTPRKEVKAALENKKEIVFKIIFQKKNIFWKLHVCFSKKTLVSWL